MYIFIRHAQRGDNQIPKLLSEINHDPPITPESAQTILETSTQLINFLKHHKIKKFKIISSKFVRCLMTAQQIEQNLLNAGFQTQSEWQLNNGIIEFLRQDWFQKNPISQPLIYQTRYLSKYVKPFSYYQSGQNINDMKFPETYVDFHLRVARFRDKLKQVQDDECILVFTHGFVVRQICWRLDYFPQWNKQIKYCGYAVCKWDGNKHILYHSKL